MTTFNHLSVPDQWQQYWSKYPQGYTILEALLNWVKQVDDMVDNVNDWNIYLDDFVKKFDDELQNTVIQILSDWQKDGTLDIIIDEALQTQIDVVESRVYDLGKNMIELGCKGDGITDDTPILTTIFANAVDGDIFYFPKGTYILSSKITITKKIKLYANGAKLVFSSAFKDSEMLAMFEISGDNAEITGFTFDGTGATHGTVSNYFLWLTGKNQKVYNNRFTNLPYGGSNFNGAIGFSSSSVQGIAESNYFNNCPGSVFSQGPRTRISNNISENPHDVSYALNSTSCIGSSITNCKVNNPVNSCSGHIAVEEGASKFTIADNYIYGVKDGIGIGCLTIAVQTVVYTGIIHNNVIDGAGLTSVNPSALISVSGNYRNIKIHDNILLNTPKGNENNVTVSINASDIEFSHNLIKEGNVTSLLATFYFSPSNGKLILEGNTFETGGSGAIIRSTTGDNGGKPIISKNNTFINGVEGFNLVSPTNMPLYMEGDTFENVTNPVNGTKWQYYFNAFKTYKFPYKINEAVQLYGDAIPTTGSWNQGDIIWNISPVSAGWMGWVCIGNGAPGTWRPFGAIQA